MSDVQWYGRGRSDFQSLSVGRLSERYDLSLAIMAEFGGYRGHACYGGVRMLLTDIHYTAYMSGSTLEFWQYATTHWLDLISILISWHTLSVRGCPKNTTQTSTFIAYFGRCCLRPHYTSISEPEHEHYKHKFFCHNLCEELLSAFCDSNGTLLHLLCENRFL